MDKATEARLCEIRSYVDSVRIRREDACVGSKDLLALGKFAQDDFFGAILLAFFYGRAKGYRAANGLPPEIQRKPASSAELENMETHTMVKSLDGVQLQAVLTTMRALAAGAESAAALDAGNAVLTAGGYPPVSVNTVNGT